MSAAPTGDQIRLDALTLRGIAHPVRLRILGLLRTDGPATAADMARLLDLNTGATSYHLRKLAKYGFVVDDPVRGPRRERRWRAAHADTVLPDELLREGSELGTTYLRALATVWSADMFRAVDASATLPPQWQGAQDFSDYGMRLTADEARRLIHRVHSVLKSRDGDATDRSGTVRYTVQIQMFPTLDDRPDTTEGGPAATAETL